MHVTHTCVNRKIISLGVCMLSPRGSIRHGPCASAHVRRTIVRAHAAKIPPARGAGLSVVDPVPIFLAHVTHKPLIKNWSNPTQAPTKRLIRASQQAYSHKMYLHLYGYFGYIVSQINVCSFGLGSLFGGSCVESERKLRIHRIRDL